VMKPTGEQQSISFQEKSIIIGRDNLADLQLDHSSISRRHARLDCDNSGNLFVTDLGSTNGTFLDGVRLTPQERMNWRNTQYLQIQGFLMQIDGVPGGQSEVEPFVFTTEQVMVLLDELNKQRSKPGIRASLSPDIVYLEPGKQQYIQVQVHAENTPLARYDLRAKPGPGIDPRWYVLPAGQVIAPGDSYVFDFVVSAPSTGTVGGKTHEIALEVVSDRADIPPVVQVLKLRIVPQTRFSIALHPNEVSNNRRRYTDMVITNSGNYSDVFSIEIEAPDTLRITPDTPQIKVEPATEQTVRLKFKPARGTGKERSRLLFSVIVRSTSGMIERSHGSYIFQRRNISTVWLVVVWALLVTVVARQFVFGLPVRDQAQQIIDFIKLVGQFIAG